MNFESVSAGQEDPKEAFEARRREIAGAVRVRLGSALEGNLSRYTDAYRKIAELELEAHKASMEEVKGRAGLLEEDRINAIKATESNVADLEAFLQEASDETKMRGRMEQDKERIQNGEGILPEGSAGGWFGSKTEILSGRQISTVDNLNAFLDEEPGLKS